MIRDGSTLILVEAPAGNMANFTGGDKPVVSTTRREGQRGNLRF